jgi:ornithine cyclodeaminase
MKTYTLEQIMQFRNFPYLMEQLEKGFVSYSKGNVIMPPVSHMHLNNPPGDIHIKCASISRAKYYVVKVASCFPENRQKDIASINGMLLLFNQDTGIPDTLFLDGGYLTHLRTAIAGAICAKYLAPASIDAIGIIGAGMQAKMQLKYLAEVTSCRKVLIWAPNIQAVEKMKSDTDLSDFKIQAVAAPNIIAKESQLIITTTPATTPLLFENDIQKGTHITAVGSDRPGKKELSSGILQKASHIIADSKAQCYQYGEIFSAIQDGSITKDKIQELGEIIENCTPIRVTGDEITIADLTGLGMQDLITALVMRIFFHDQSR